MQIVPLQAVPSQTVAVILNQQLVKLNVYQKFFGLFIDIYLNGTLLLAGQFCLNKKFIVRSTYLGFSGDLAFVDTQGTANPIYTGLGARFQLQYLLPEEVEQAQVLYQVYVNSIAGLSDVLARYPTLGVTIASVPNLNSLSLSGISFAVGSVRGTTIGAVLGTTVGSSLVLGSTFGNMLQLTLIGNIWQLQVGSNPVPTPQTLNVTLIETLSGYTNSPNTTTNLIVTASSTVQLLSSLSLSGSTFPINSPLGTAIGAVAGVTAGSTLTLVNTFGGAVRLVQIGGVWILQVGSFATTSAQNYNLSITETLAGYSNSPNTTINMVVSATGVIIPPTGTNVTLADGLGVIQYF